MNKADWMTGLAGIVGVLGIGLGYWWADAVAALVISADITRDGVLNLKRVCEDLLDVVPREVGSDRQDPLLEKIKEALRKMDWVAESDVRIREEGHVFSGEALVVPKHFDDGEELVKSVEKARGHIIALDWRLYEFSIMPASSIKTPGKSQGPRR